ELVLLGIKEAHRVEKHSGSKNSIIYPAACAVPESSNKGTKLSDAIPEIRLRPGSYLHSFFFFQAEDGIRDRNVTGVQTCALPIYKVLICSFLQHFLGGTLQKTHRRIRSTWAKAYASNAEPLQLTDRRQPLPNHDIDGKIKFLHKPSDRSRFGQTHGIDAIGPCVSVRQGAMNSFFELRLLVACSKS